MPEMDIESNETNQRLATQRRTDLSKFETNNVATPSKKSNEVDFKQPSNRNPLIKRWKESDPLFKGKFSTGATPKITK